MISYEFVKDSLNKKHLLLQKEISEIEKNNLELNNKINDNNTQYLFVILAIVILLGGLLFISFKKRLKESENHKKVLEKQNIELKRTLISKEEKETLLKEIHHRVKNNLQIINSLIRLQSNYMTASNYKEKLAETENRIRSMALVHEKLYKSENGGGGEGGGVLENMPSIFVIIKIIYKFYDMYKLIVSFTPPSLIFTFL